MPVFAFFDTTAFTGARDLTSTSWQKISTAIGQGILVAATSQITVLESARQAAEVIDAKIKQISEASVVLAPLGVEIVIPDRPDERSIGQVLPDWLDVNGIAVLQIPAVPHAEVVARDLAVRASFVRSGKGYRDALIWHSFLEWADTVPGLGVDTMYFVTSNTQDFCAPSGGLKRELLAELPAAVSVEVLQRPQDLSAKLNLLTSLTTETIVTECALRLIDTALVHEPVDNDLHHWSTVVEEVTVSEVFADDGVPELVETLAGETQLWRVEISAELGVTGYVYKGDLGGLDGSLSVVDPDWNDHYVEVSGRVACTVAVLVRIEADLETCEAEIMELIA